MAGPLADERHVNKSGMFLTLQACSLARNAAAQAMARVGWEEIGRNEGHIMLFRLTHGHSHETLLWCQEESNAAP